MHTSGVLPPDDFNHKRLSILLSTSFHQSLNNPSCALLESKVRNISASHRRFDSLFPPISIVHLKKKRKSLTPGFIPVTTNPSLESASAHCTVREFNAALEILYAGSGKMPKGSAIVKEPIVLALQQISG
jgi:hypothetical protein